VVLRIENVCNFTLQNVRRRCENFVSLFAARLVTQNTGRYGPWLARSLSMQEI